MIRSLVVVLALVSCSKDSSEAAPAKAAPKSPPPAAAPATPAKDAARRIDIKVDGDGYTPAKIVGKPEEKLVLVFTRTVDAECISKVKTPDGKLVDLPMNKPVDVPVTVPKSGELGFACAMDMFHGTIVAQQ